MTRIVTHRRSPEPDGALVRFTAQMNLSALAVRLRAAFWLVPAACVIAAMVAAPLIARLDAFVGPEGGTWFGGGAESARQILGVVASSVLTFAGLVFSITIVALQLASSQFSPRVLRSFLRDRYTQVSLGLFIGTFNFALLTLREVRGTDAVGGEFVPGLSVSVTVVLALASVTAAMVYIHHMAQSVRVVVVIDRIAAETRRSLDRLYPGTGQSQTPAPSLATAPGQRRLVDAEETGVLFYIDSEDLVETAVDHDLTIELLMDPGTYVIAGQPLFQVTGPAEFDLGSLHDLVDFESERDIDQDPAYGFRQLVDIAERAISPAVNDPTTAVQCIDRIHALLRRIAPRDLAVGNHVVDGVLRLRVPMPDWVDYIGLACNELRHWGGDAPRIQRRLQTMLRDLRDYVDADRRTAVLEQMQLLAFSRHDELPEYEWDMILGPGDPAERPPHGPITDDL
jgi:uncharacterized membrane protein